MYPASRPGEIASFEITQRQSIKDVQVIEAASCITGQGKTRTEQNRAEARKNK